VRVSLTLPELCVSQCHSHSGTRFGVSGPPDFVVTVFVLLLEKNGVGTFFRGVVELAVGELWIDLVASRGTLYGRS
jgi:hypothetical protein